MSFKSDISKLDRWLEKAGISGSRLGSLAFGHPSVIKRLRAGKVRFSTYQRVMAYIDTTAPGKIKKQQTNKRS